MTMLDMYYCLHCANCKQVSVDWDDTRTVTGVLCTKKGPVSGDTAVKGCYFYEPRKCCASCHYVERTAKHEGGHCVIDEYGIFKIMTTDKSLLCNSCERWHE